MDHWRWLERLPGWRVDWAFTPARGLCRWRDRVILLDPRLSHRDERSVLVHECVHAERGPVPRWMLSREEEAVAAESSRRLIPIRRLAAALAWSRDAHEVADELDVDVATVMARVRHLHPAERAYLARRLEHVTP